VSGNLDKLKSYRANLTASIDGKNAAGAPAPYDHRRPGAHTGAHADGLQRRQF
jgi:hypothetical protein